MSKNKVQFQSGCSLPGLFHEYGTEVQCPHALFDWNWPEEFVCPECGAMSFGTLKTCRVYQCNYCHYQTSFIRGTFFDNTKLPLSHCFLLLYLITLSKTDLSALEFKRQIFASAVSISDEGHSIAMIMNVLKGFRLSVISKWSKQHLPRKLAGFCYRFNRCFHLEDMPSRFTLITVRTPPMSIKLLKIAESYG